MKRLCLTACAVAASLCVLPLRAEDAGTHSSNQREKFAACAHDSRGLKGEERRQFMSDCLKKHGAHESHDAVLGEAAAQGRLNPCNTEADRRKLHGDERSAFMSACLKG